MIASALKQSRLQFSKDIRPSEIVMSAFGWLDWGVLVLMLILSTLVGCYFGYFRDKVKSVDDFLTGGGKLKTLPVAVSLIAR